MYAAFDGLPRRIKERVQNCHDFAHFRKLMRRRGATDADISRDGDDVPQSRASRGPQAPKRVARASTWTMCSPRVSRSAWTPPRARKLLQVLTQVSSRSTRFVSRGSRTRSPSGTTGPASTTQRPITGRTCGASKRVTIVGDTPYYDASQAPIEKRPTRFVNSEPGPTADHVRRRSIADQHAGPIVRATTTRRARSDRRAPPRPPTRSVRNPCAARAGRRDLMPRT